MQPCIFLLHAFFFSPVLFSLYLPFCPCHLLSFSLSPSPFQFFPAFLLWNKISHYNHFSIFTNCTLKIYSTAEKSFVGNAVNLQYKYIELCIPFSLRFFSLFYLFACIFDPPFFILPSVFLLVDLPWISHISRFRFLTVMLSLLMYSSHNWNHHNITEQLHSNCFQPNNIPFTHIILHEHEICMQWTSF